MKASNGKIVELVPAHLCDKCVLSKVSPEELLCSDCSAGTYFVYAEDN